MNITLVLKAHFVIKLLAVDLCLLAWFVKNAEEMHDDYDDVGIFA